MRSAREAFCLLLLAVAAAAQIDTRHLSGQSQDTFYELLKQLHLTRIGFFRSELFVRIQYKLSLLLN